MNPCTKVIGGGRGGGSKNPSLGNYLFMILTTDYFQLGFLYKLVLAFKC